MKAGEVVGSLHVESSDEITDEADPTRMAHVRRAKSSAQPSAMRRVCAAIQNIHHLQM